MHLSHKTDINLYNLQNMEPPSGKDKEGFWW